jgi:xanthine dehydrogenase YagR molybdenum-binding subunit
MRDGIVTVQSDMTDIGTGSYTIIAQTAAEMMGVAIDKVTVAWATRASRSRPAPAASGAQTPATAGVYAACVKLREAVRKSSASTRPMRVRRGRCREAGNAPSRCSGRA